MCWCYLVALQSKLHVNIFVKDQRHFCGLASVLIILRPFAFPISHHLINTNCCVAHDGLDVVATVSVSLVPATYILHNTVFPVCLYIPPLRRLQAVFVMDPKLIILAPR